MVAPLGDKNPTSPVSGTVTLTDDQVKMLQSAKLYVNVHTAANPGGEIRGQIRLHASKQRQEGGGCARQRPLPATDLRDGTGCGAEVTVRPSRSGRGRGGRLTGDYHGTFPVQL